MKVDELRVSRASIPINDIGTPQSRKGRLAADALRQSIDNLKRKGILKNGVA